ncbi:ABC transporter ATP-binding protein [Cellulomonas uda]|uniref:ABC transporter ATP-binding protein n=1 Tax=Cellulomonas uda TaxID=1714 RepID=A0A4Y3K8L8_CELUD|nr:ABC transporter ATP-binding protein [Cellulomonas uda]NII66427.1 ABC-2 type transport system ATP-binding protein [Cellulomonas uda]GEA80307.1 ABC transporter ATP-binding protein [Cellulomonas uda]
MTRDEHVVVADHVTRRFGAVVALHDVSLSVGQGELVGLLGPNGAGKTTLLSLVAGLRKPDAGTVRLFGGDPRDARSRLSLGTTPQETGLPSTLRVQEVVALVAGHYAAPMPTGELLERFGLQDLARRQTGGLSGGQKRRLAVALALVGRPRLVLLDEPTTGLDVEGRHVLWQALRDYHAEGATVLLTSHYLEEVEALAHRVVVVGHGRVLADGGLADVVALVARRRVLVTVPADALPRLERLPGVEVLEAAGRPEGVRVTLLAADADELVRTLVGQDAPFRDLEVRGASLEEAFLALTASDGVLEPGRAAAEPVQEVRS